MMLKKIAFLCFSIFLVQCQSEQNPYFVEEDKNVNILEDLVLHLKNNENREFSYTNKQDAYYYAQSHAQPNTKHFAGWNVATKRIFSDYVILVDGQNLDRKNAQASVYPHFLKRFFPKESVTENFYLFDYQEVIRIDIESKAQKIALSLVGENLSFEQSQDEILFYRSESFWVGICAKKTEKLEIFQKDSLKFAQTNAKSEGFFIGLAPTKEDLIKKLQEAQQKHQLWQQQRQQRMRDLLTKQNYFYSSDTKLTSAIRWNILTLDQLIMRQTGYGIYAGLPWFNDYWGRDMFISLEGACLLTGQFEIAEQMLKDFAHYQNQDSTSKYFGRVPNRLRPNDIIYNTTDGTPRFVISCKNLSLYTGKTQLDQHLENAVVRATEGALKNWTNSRGYLAHEDADTWMDAKIENQIPWSPRGTVANDIQALWYEQLQSLNFFKENKKIADLSQKTTPIAQKLLQNFRTDFWSDSLQMMADRIHADGKKDFSVRPNQLYALPLLERIEQKQAVTEKVWRELVYPWGVSSLSQSHEEFHPYHENPDFYHKDAAYHNGTVWLWNNGAAMEKMLEIGKVQTAYQLFENMTQMLLEQGAVGSLAENTDAHLLPNAKKIRLTGTFLQAWSAAEYLRVWYKFFVGFQPKENFLLLKPLPPDQVYDFVVHQRYQKGFLKTKYIKEKMGESVLEYSFENIATKIRLEIPNFETIDLQIAPNDKLLLVFDQNELEITHFKAQNQQTETLQKKALGKAIPEKIIDFASPQQQNWKALQEVNFLDKKRRQEWQTQNPSTKK